ncbi:unnamed protein product [Didymodactylos carnosus]|uniref:Uncharacterized protein n=1 Tax=Didymodactylos carnosus TaxID=1234261 RepID=A0A816BNT5_9BILA|nr:unnamed protein product [Didymodactylos carnosus]CAF4494573.1 unnamed protein product [Didymodactylos carnosus]
MLCFVKRYASDGLVCTSDTKNIGAGRLSNATIESYFSIIKVPRLQRKTRPRPAQLVSEIFQSTQARLKAGKYGVIQTNKGRRKRAKNNTDINIIEV